MNSTHVYEILNKSTLPQKQEYLVHVVVFSLEKHERSSASNHIQGGETKEKRCLEQRTYEKTGGRKI